MSVEWSGVSPELIVDLDRDQPTPLKCQLERALRQAVQSGRLTVGERLPSSRELAGTLGISRGIVQDCYAQLQAEGYLTTRVGSATRVAATAQVPPTQPKPVTPQLDIDFASGVPDLASFPRTDWAWAMREACRRAPNTALDYGDPRGDAHLREVLAAYLRRVRGAAADPERMVICSGFSQGLALTLKVLAANGITQIAFEDPGYGDTGAAACALSGATLVPVPIDEDGIDVDALDRTAARAVVLTPAHQWPTGVVLAPHRRQALVEWANRKDAYIIEDDYDAEFRYDREPVGVLQGLAPDRVAAIGTVSKSLVPAVRLGWIVCPPNLADHVAELKKSSDHGSPGLDQLTLATMIESGRFDRHLRRMRQIYAQRRNVLVDALRPFDVELTGLAAGFHAVAHIAADERAVIEKARVRGVGLYGMSVQRSDRATTPSQLVLGFGNLGERAIRTGMAKVGDLFKTAR
ncbi:PLP-dependent aminotransferase family protein [Actinocrispum wychmicini]|uniref:GntR family transcriptional regulator/MocR family aminotransferase n=1 Tax=Actinocrispum wychmicini TaxID=1213861 RepID=A0A4R2K7G7_9PSEU|nr:PLP-dependent aminotransferase family protein [Actinocrispum wychmicini]TCO65916.1 GntR family transcriptional regulator/MocR family aminotransferase [Actinocrispum wychmicini]